MRKFKEEGGGRSEEEEEERNLCQHSQEGALTKPALEFTQITIKQFAEITHAYTVAIGVNV